MAWPNDPVNGETARQVLVGPPQNNITHWATKCEALLALIKDRADHWTSNSPGNTPPAQAAAHARLVMARSRLKTLSEAGSELYQAWQEVDNPGGGGD